MHSAKANPTFTVNNFDLIRLFAALQVAHFHIVHIMQIDVPGWYAELIRVLGLFPGVPIFFFISGFLISKSWEKNADVKAYGLNRILRIYPALFIVVSLSFILINVSGYVQHSEPSFGQLATLFIAKSTIFQFYNPDFMRGYGDGVMNGSLWTISVELQFYVLTPILYFLMFRTSSSNWKLVISIVFFLACSIVFHAYRGVLSEELWYKIIRVSFIPWFYMFLVGVFFQRNFDFFYRFLCGKFVHCLLLYGFIALVARSLGADFGNSINPVMFFCLAALIFSAAYTRVTLSRDVLRRTDISYGVYIYHMPIVNFLLYSGYGSDARFALVAMVVTIALATASWIFVEKNFLRLKPKTIKPEF